MTSSIITSIGKYRRYCIVNIARSDTQIGIVSPIPIPAKYRIGGKPSREMSQTKECCPIQRSWHEDQTLAHRWCPKKHAHMTHHTPWPWMEDSREQWNHHRTRYVCETKWTKCIRVLISLGSRANRWAVARNWWAQDNSIEMFDMLFAGYTGYRKLLHAKTIQSTRKFILNLY